MITEKESTMSDTRPAAPAVSSAEPKWWVHSVTVWGTVVTTLTAVLPIIGPVFGVDVTADLARQLGEEVTRTVQALGALIGVGMAIYGRARASAPLERRPMTLQL
jgi:hypothetical protein